MAEWEAAMKEETEEEKQVYLIKDEEENQVEVKVRIDEGEMLRLESTWDDPKEEKAEQRENISHSKRVVQGMTGSLIAHGESRAQIVSLSKTKLHASAHPHPKNVSSSTHHKNIPTISLLVVSHLKRPLTI